MDRAVLDSLFTTHNWQQHFEDCISEGLDVDSSSYGDGWTLLHYAMEAENFEAVEWLVSNGADINATDEKGWTVLHCIAQSEIEIALAANMAVELRGAQFLIEKGAREDIKSKDGQTAKDIVATYGADALKAYGEITKELTPVLL